jgi:uncharacterized protein YndB with AHSA1/START domain
MMSNTRTVQVTTPTDREIVVTRVFNAPRRMVYDAFTRPELVKRWMTGPHGWWMELCEMDLRAGGGFRQVWRGPDGQEMAMSGVHREVVEPERVVRTEIFQLKGQGASPEQLGTAAFTEQTGETLVTITVLYPSKESRDGALASGMARGMGEAYERLDAVLAANGAAAHQA